MPLVGGKTGIKRKYKIPLQWFLSWQTCENGLKSQFLFYSLVTTELGKFEGEKLTLNGTIRERVGEMSSLPMSSNI